MTPNDVIDSLAFWSLISSIASLIVAAVAIALAWVFYSQGRDTENRVEVALAEIKAQTDTLQKISGSQIRQLTKAVTQQSPTEKALLDAILQMRSSNIAAQIDAPSSTADVDALRREMISAYIAIHHYAAVSNRTLGYLSYFITDDDTKQGIRTMVDSTHVDFQKLDEIINGLSPPEVESNPLSYLYQITETLWKPGVMNSADLIQTQSDESAT